VIDSLAGQGIDVGHACRVLRVSRSGFYAWKDCPALARALRHLWLAGEITDVHRESGGIYGERRVAAELRYGRGILVNRKTVTLLMRRLGIYGLPKKRLPKGAKVGKYAAGDLVRREFTVTAPNRLWMTDITEHPTREGKVYCCKSSTRSPARSSAGRSIHSRTRCSSRAP
jgi:putative transposase